MLLSLLNIFGTQFLIKLKFNSFSTNFQIYNNRTIFSIHLQKIKLMDLSYMRSTHPIKVGRVVMLL